MGVDFIKKSTDRWRKGWSRERQKLGIRQLFNGQATRAQTIDVSPFKAVDFREGEPYELQVELGRIFVYSRGRSIGVCATPPRHVVREIASLGGKTLGALRKTAEKKQQVEILVLLPSMIKENAATK